MKNNPKSLAQCEICGKEFKPFRESKGRFCSRACCTKWRRIEGDIQGKKFQKLTAIARAEKREGRSEEYWKFQCDCGKIKILKKSPVVRGRTHSCGCYNTEFNKNRRGERSPQWLGEDSKDESILRWINKNFPRDTCCYFCSSYGAGGKRGLYRIPKKGKYTRDPFDYYTVCMSCIKKGMHRISF